MRTDECAHHTNAFFIVENDERGPMLPEQILGTLEVSIFSNDDAGNPEQQGCARAHDARAERADQGQLCPVSPPARVAKADGFCVRRRVSRLHPQVMSTGYDLAMLVRKNRADRQPAFAQPFPRFFESLLQ